MVKYVYIKNTEIYLGLINLSTNNKDITLSDIDIAIDESEKYINMLEAKIKRYAITNPKDYQVNPKDAKYNDDEMVYYDGVLNYIEQGVEDNLLEIRDEHMKLNLLYIIKNNFSNFEFLD